jgi:hypothetical protein
MRWRRGQSASSIRGKGETMRTMAWMVLVSGCAAMLSATAANELPAGNCAAPMAATDLVALRLLAQETGGARTLHGAKLAGRQAGEHRSQQVQSVRARTCVGSNAKWANFTGATLAGANLRDADLFHATFDDADLGGAKLQGANLFGSNLINTRAVRADFSRRLSEGHADGRHRPQPADRSATAMRFAPCSSARGWSAPTSRAPT